MTHGLCLNDGIFSTTINNLFGPFTPTERITLFIRFGIT